MSKPAEVQSFRPILQPRRTELNAWILAGLVAAAGIALPKTGVSIWVGRGLGAFFLLSAVSISLGNWIDRRSALQLRADGVAFQNGLRNVDFAWSQVNKVQVFPSRWGKKIFVVGEKARFAFSSLTEVSLQGKAQRSGFENGEEILGIILRQSGLLDHKHQNNDNYYYQRE